MLSALEKPEIEDLLEDLLDDDEASDTIRRSVQERIRRASQDGVCVSSPDVPVHSTTTATAIQAASSEETSTTSRRVPASIWMQGDDSSSTSEEGEEEEEEEEEDDDETFTNLDVQRPPPPPPSPRDPARDANENEDDATASSPRRRWTYRDPEDRIGQGAFAEVFRVRRRGRRSSKPSDDVASLPYAFALKRLRLSAYDNEDEIEALRNEVQIHAALKHPHIVELVETYHAPIDDDDETTSDDHPQRPLVLHMIMEYADYGSLQELIKQHGAALTWTEKTHYVVQLCDALSYLHDHLIVHRDIKPLNVFLTGPNGRIVKLGDFGISVRRPTRDTWIYEAVGTPYYLSPEICEGKAYDDRSDVWALGCTVYELCTTRKAFSAASVAGLVNAICRGEPPTLPQKDDDDDAARLATLMCDMLIKRAEDRATMRTLKAQHADTFRIWTASWASRRRRWSQEERSPRRRLKRRNSDDIPTYRNRAYKEENLKKIIANYKDEETLRRQVQSVPSLRRRRSSAVHLHRHHASSTSASRRDETSRDDDDNDAGEKRTTVITKRQRPTGRGVESLSHELMSKRSWYGLRRLHMFGVTSRSRPRWICQHLLSRLRAVSGNAGGHMIAMTTDQGLVLTAGRTSLDGDNASGRSLGHLSWIRERDASLREALRGIMTTIGGSSPNDDDATTRRARTNALATRGARTGIMPSIRLGTAPPLPYFGSPLDMEQTRLDVLVLNYDPKNRQLARTSAYCGDRDDDDDSVSTASSGSATTDEDVEDLSAGTLDFQSILDTDEWKTYMWYVQYMMLMTCVRRLRESRGAGRVTTSYRRELRGRVRSSCEILTQRRRSLIVQRRRAALLRRRLHDHASRKTTRRRNAEGSDDDDDATSRQTLRRESSVESMCVWMMEETALIEDMLSIASRVLEESVEEEDDVRGGSNRLRAADVTCGSSHAVVRTEDGSLWMWGRPCDDVFSAKEIRDGLGLTSVVGGASGDWRRAVGEEEMKEDEEQDEDEDEDEDWTGLCVLVEDNEDEDSNARFVGLSVPHRMSWFEIRGVRVTSVSCGGELEGAGNTFTMFLTDRGVVYAFGAHTEGALGLGDDVDETCTPRVVTDLPPIERLACGESHVVAVCRRGDVYAWGDNEEGQLGIGRVGDVETTPRWIKRWVRDCETCRCGRVVSTTRDGVRDERSFPRRRRRHACLPVIHIEGIAAGRAHTAAWTTSGEVYTWGQGRGGRLGLHRSWFQDDDDDETGGRGEIVSTPTMVSFAVAEDDEDAVDDAADAWCVRKVSCGTEHTIALVERRRGDEEGKETRGGVDVSVYAWGRVVVDAEEDETRRDGGVTARYLPTRVSYFDKQNPVDVFASGGSVEYCGSASSDGGALTTQQQDMLARCYVLCRPPLAA